MIRYTPGSHLLAAAVAMWLRVDASRVVYALMAGSVALKSALLFLVTARVLPETRSPVHAAAAPVLSMVPAEYFFGSVLKYGFYAHVASETFAVGMLLATVMWAQEGKRIWLVAFAFCGCDVSGLAGVAAGRYARAPCDDGDETDDRGRRCP